MNRKTAIAAALAAALASLSLAGTASAAGTSASVTTAPDALDFGQVTTGAASAAKDVTLSVPCLYVLDLGQYGGKSCSAAGKVEAVATSGDFEQSNDCVLPISNSSTSGQVVTCTVSVRFRPTAAGAATGELSFTSYGSAGAYPVALSGTGVAPAPIEKPGEKGGEGKGTGGSGTAGAVAKKCKKAKKGAARSTKSKKCKKRKVRR